MDNIFFKKSDLKYCGENVIIGKTVRIRHPSRCIIHDGSIIDDFCYISSAVEIGRHCHIASNVSISGGSGSLYMGDYSTLSNHCSVHCGSSDYRKVSLDIPSIPAPLRFGGETLPISIGRFVTIGAHSTILPGATIPDGLACGAYSLLKNVSYRPWSLYVGIPVRWVAERDKTDFEKSPLFNLYHE
jgi:acetyltransferase-like isoleucine patch superfamily enzyme